MRVSCFVPRTVALVAPILSGSRLPNIRLSAGHLPELLKYHSAVCSHRVERATDNLTHKEFGMRNFGSRGSPAARNPSGSAYC